MAAHHTTAPEAIGTAPFTRNPAELIAGTDAAAVPYPAEPISTRQNNDADALMALAHQVYGEFADRTTFANVHATVRRCCHDLDTANVPARPALVGRLARQRLTRQLQQARLRDEAHVPV